MRTPLAAVLLAGLAACDVAATGLRSGFWPLRFWAEEAKGQEAFVNEYGIPARDIVTPAGEPLPFLSDPFGPAEVRQRADHDGLNVVPGYSEGKPAAYLTAEVWMDWPPIWVQPLYLPVSEWDAAAPGSKLLPGALPVFSVGERSTFYSPFWVVYYAVVPPGTDPGTLKTSKAVLDVASALHRGPTKTCSIVPEGLLAAVAEGATAPVHPFTGGEIQPVRLGAAWADGIRVSVLDFGVDRFEYDEGGIVEETPFFALSVAAVDGRKMLPVPKVGATAPFKSGRKGRAPGNRPAFGSLWRIYTALVPPTAGVFVPSSLPALRQRVLDVGGVTVPAIAREIEARPDVRDYLLRVALKPACFSDPASFPHGCDFLDSQEAVEGLLPEHAFERLPMTVNCPWVHYAGQKVPYP